MEGSRHSQIIVTRQQSNGQFDRLIWYKLQKVEGNNHNDVYKWKWQINIFPNSLNRRKRSTYHRTELRNPKIVKMEGKNPQTVEQKDIIHKK